MKIAASCFLIVFFAMLGFSAHAELPVGELNREKPVDFATEIFPVLKANCLACHNSTKAKADLILENPQAMKDGGDSGPALFPGDADGSLIFTTASHIEEPVMPPPNNKSKAENLSPLELALLKRWINEGAKGESVSNPAPKNWTLLTGNQPIYTSAITKDGRFAAVGRGQKIDLYDLRLGKYITSLRDAPFPAAHRDLVQALAFAPDGTLASGGFRIAKLWKPSKAGAGTPLSLPSPAVSFAISKEDNSMAIGQEDGTVGLYNLNQTKLSEVTYKDHAGKVLDLEFSKDAAWIYSVGSDNKINRRSLKEANNQSSLSVAGTTISLVHHDNYLLVGSQDAQLQLFPADLKTAEPVFVFKKEASPVMGLESSGENLFVAHENGVVIHYRLDPADPKKPPAEVKRFTHGTAIHHFAVSENRIATADATGSVKLWNLADGKLIAELEKDPLSPRKIAALQREIAVAKRIKAARDRQAADAEKLWKSESEKAKQSGDAIAKARRQIVAKKALLAAAEKDSDKQKYTEELKQAKQALTTALRNRDSSSRLAGEALAEQSLALANSTEATTLTTEIEKEIAGITKATTETAKKFAATGLGFSPDGSALAVALKEGGLRFHAANDGTWVEDIPGVASLAHMQLSPDGKRLFVATKEKKLIPWDLPGATWSLAKTLGNGSDADPFSDRVSALAFHPDGSLLLAGSGVPSRNGEISLWSTDTWNKVAQNPKAHGDTITSFAFSPDGNRFVSGATDRLVRTFDTATLMPIKTYEGHSSHVLDVDWNADGLTLASSGADLQVKIWNIETTKEKSKVAGFQKEVSSVKFVAASESVLTASGDKSIKLANQPLSGSGKTFLHTAAASADGSVIIAGGQDGILRVWDGKSKQLIKEFPNLPGAEEVKLAAGQ